jgi:hypothetical protein
MREQAFTYTFSINHNQTKTMIFSLGPCTQFLSLTVEIEDENLGPILINAKVTSGSMVFQLGKPTNIFDGDGINAKRFVWDKGPLPLSRDLKNKLIINASNYCGDDIESVRFTGVKRR